MQAYILDPHLRPKPIGIPGELYLGGVGLARGYLNRPQLTAQCFIPDPFSQQAGARLYKTGDLARYLPDGNIEFLGRMDYQVKVRGLRIELGEIETVLGQHPAVQEAVVLAREDLPGGKQLVAYLVANCVPRPTVNELRNFLKEKLPDYMVPSIYAFLDALPLMPNGKVDRRSLPVPDMRQPNLLRSYAAPTNPTQELLVDIWARIFEIERVGIDDDFFELGGHSLLATQLVFLVRETFQIDLPLRRFLENPTIVGLAQAIAAFRQAGPAIAMTATSPDLKAEAVLDPSIRPKTVTEPSTAQRTEAHSIFLTGATGFLGTFLLYELLQQTQADIYCLVRAPDVEAGQQRIRKSLESYSLWRQRLGSRIVPVAGDLSQPFLGLSVPQFQALAGRIDAIYHNGALVNFVYPYHELKPTNVLGTQEVLRLATQSKAVPVHHISTISVFNFSGYYHGRPIGEEEELDHNQGLQVGYAQSKWVAEKLVTEARVRGLPVCIYRLGTVAGDSRTGGWKTDDYVCRFIKGCIQLGSIPDQDGGWRLAPVDYVSQAIVYLSRQPTTTGKVFNLIAPHRLDLSELADWIRAFGYELRSSSYERWLADLSEVMRHSPEHPLYPLLPLLKERGAAAQGDLRFECQNVVEGLAGTSIACPPIDARLLGTYFSYFVRSGFLDAPPPGGTLKYYLRGANRAISSTVEGIECS
jgi:thioester reductase-like protein